jgi:hypothetical protein
MVLTSPNNLKLQRLTTIQAAPLMTLFFIDGTTFEFNGTILIRQ